jgi:hypothetical protein
MCHRATSRPLPDWDCQWRDWHRHPTSFDLENSIWEGGKKAYTNQFPLPSWNLFFFFFFFCRPMPHLIHSYCLAKQPNHAHDLDGVLGIILWTEFHESKTLMLSTQFVFRNVYIYWKENEWEEHRDEREKKRCLIDDNQHHINSLLLFLSKFNFQTIQRSLKLNKFGKSTRNKSVAKWSVDANHLLFQYSQWNNKKIFNHLLVKKRKRKRKDIFNRIRSTHQLGHIVPSTPTRCSR